jgi:hypothetical protein
MVQVAEDCKVSGWQDLSMLTLPWLGASSCRRLCPTLERIMSPCTTALLAIAMSTDAFAAADGKGSARHKPRFSEALRTGAIFAVACETPRRILTPINVQRVYLAQAMHGEHKTQSYIVPWRCRPEPQADAALRLEAIG